MRCVKRPVYTYMCADNVDETRSSRDVRDEKRKVKKFRSVIGKRKPCSDAVVRNRNFWDCGVASAIARGTRLACRAYRHIVSGTCCT